MSDNFVIDNYMYVVGLSIGLFVCLPVCPYVCLSVSENSSEIWTKLDTLVAIVHR